MDIVIPIGIYCYFGFVLLVESCEVSVSKTQSVNKRYLICQKPTPKRTIAKHFSQDIFPSSVGIGCKGTTKFAFLQILSGKSDCDKYLNNNTGLMDKEKIEHSTISRDNRRIFIYSAGNRRELDRWHSTGKVLDGNTVVTEWYRGGNEKESEKMYEKEEEDRAVILW